MQSLPSSKDCLQSLPSMVVTTIFDVLSVELVHLIAKKLDLKTLVHMSLMSNSIREKLSHPPFLWEIIERQDYLINDLYHEIDMFNYNDYMEYIQNEPRRLDCGCPEGFCHCWSFMKR